MRLRRRSNNTIDRRILLNKSLIQYRQRSKLLRKMPNLQRALFVDRFGVCACRSYLLAGSDQEADSPAAQAPAVPSNSTSVCTAADLAKIADTPRFAFTNVGSAVIVRGATKYFAAYPTGEFGGDWYYVRSWTWFCEGFK